MTGRAGASAPSRSAPEAEVYQALCLGVRDYAGKNGFKQVVMGISGGIDSALTACIAADALGADRVNTVSMPSRYSSEGTKSDARETAERLGVRLSTRSRSRACTATYLESLAPYLVAAAPGVTEQNIQARIRGNLLMALSNKFGWLVLTTGNKSEMAVGYATLYGDMAGGFAVLKDVPKTLVYRLARVPQLAGPGGGPIPAVDHRAGAVGRAGAPTRPTRTRCRPTRCSTGSSRPTWCRTTASRRSSASGLDGAVVREGGGHDRRQRVQAPAGAPGVRITPKAFGKDRRLPITNRYRG